MKKSFFNEKHTAILPFSITYVVLESFCMHMCVYTYVHAGVRLYAAAAAAAVLTIL